MAATKNERLRKAARKLAAQINKKKSAPKKSGTSRVMKARQKRNMRETRSIQRSVRDHHKTVGNRGGTYPKKKKTMAEKQRNLSVGRPRYKNI